MAVSDFNPEEKEKIRKNLSSKLNKAFLIFIGITIIVVLGLFFFGNGGSLFKGLMVQNLEEGAGGPPGLELPTFAPTIISKTPQANAINYSKNAGTAWVIFDEAALTFDVTQNATVKKQNSDTDLSTNAMTYTEATKTLSIPYNALEDSSVYTITVPAVTIKNDGEPLESNIVWSFTTAPANNAPTPPTIVSKTPTDGATGISKNAGSATIVFAEAGLTLDGNQDATIKKQGSATDKSTNAMTYNEATKTLTIPYTELEMSSIYTITVPAATIKNNNQALAQSVVWLFTTSDSNNPPPPVACTENNLQNSDKEICKGSAWVTCTPALELAKTKSTDGTKECKSEKWQAVAAQPNGDGSGSGSDNSCTENQTKDDDKKLCKDKDWITCTDAKEGQKSTDDKKECKDSKWKDIDATPPKSGGDIKITKDDVMPKGFNPLINETKITYEISAKAKMEIKILDHTGVTVVTLIDNKEVEKGDYYVWWNGTDNATEAGEVVPKGDYTYKIIAKDPVSGEMKDVKTGSITALYSVAGEEDFENVDAGNDVTNSTDSSGQESSNSESSSNNNNANNNSSDAMATVSLQSAQTGVTAGTGTPVLIYLLFPLTGYLLSKKYKK